MVNSLFKRFREIIIIDVETTGFNPKADEIIEFAALRLVNASGQPPRLDDADILIRLSESKRLPLEITQLTGISTEQLACAGVDKSRACAVISEWLDHPGALLVAYNAQFDLGFIRAFLTRFGQASLIDNLKFLDAMTVYKDRKPYPHTLKDAVAAYALKTQNTHRAIDDVNATYELLCAMAFERDDLDRYVNLFGYNPKYGVNGDRIRTVTYRPQPYNGSKRLYE